MLIHSVFFWLRRGLTKDKRKEFVSGLEKLRGIDQLEDIYIGVPAPTTRPAVDRTYDYALTVIMKDLEVHRHYQEHPLHKEFLDKYSSDWIKVVIYDPMDV